MTVLGIVAAAACVQLASGAGPARPSSVDGLGAATAQSTATPEVPASGSVPSVTSTPLPSAAQPPGAVVVPPTTTAAPTATGTQDPVVLRGRELFGVGCAGCHGQTGGGSQNGPSLVGVGAASSDFQLSTGRMPLAQEQQAPKRSKPSYDRNDINALNAYVASLGAGLAIPQVSPGNLAQGRRIYLTNCASCHSSTAVGAALPDGRYAPSLLPSQPTQIAEAVRLGPGLMPRFPETVLPRSDLDSLVTYVQSLQAGGENEGGWPLGGLGPVSEGIIGWVLGLGILLVVIRALGKRSR